MSEKKESLQRELSALKDSEGLLHAERVVTWAARHPNSALYNQFEWDNTVAAHQYRIWQARELIVTVTYESGGPQMVSLSVDRVKGGGYREVSDVIKDRELSEIMLRDALAELDRIRIKYKQVKQLVPVWDEVDHVRKPTKKEA